MSQVGILSDSTSPGRDVETITGNTGGAVGPDASFNINLLGSGNLTVTGNPATNTLTISENSAVLLTSYTDVTTTPYSVVSTDYYLSVNTSIAITIQLPNTPTAYRAFIIKDRTGNSGANTITVTTAAGLTNIDGVISYTINSNYASIQIVGNGTSYEVY